MISPAAFDRLSAEERVAWLSNLSDFERTVLREAYRRRYGVIADDATVFATYLAIAQSNAKRN